MERPPSKAGHPLRDSWPAVLSSSGHTTSDARTAKPLQRGGSRRPAALPIGRLTTAPEGRVGHGLPVRQTGVCRTLGAQCRRPAKSQRFLFEKHCRMSVAYDNCPRAVFRMVGSGTTHERSNGPTRPSTLTGAGSSMSTAACSAVAWSKTGSASGKRASALS
jgi:hypothetical protein